MRVIYKYPLNFEPHKTDTAIRLPSSSRIVGVGIDANNQICIWIDRPTDHPDLKMHTEQFRIVGTGIEFESSCWHSVGMVISLPFVWHVLQFGRDPVTT